MKTYTVKATRSGRWWALTVPAVRGVHTQARRLSDAPAMATEAVALALDVDPESLQVDIVIDLTDDVQAVIERSRRVRAEADRLRAEAATTSREAVRALLQSGLTQQDAATILGVSFQRVSQLAR